MDDRGAYVGVVVRMLEQLQRGKRPIIHGDGNQTFDFVHAVDVAHFAASGGGDSREIGFS